MLNIRESLLEKYSKAQILRIVADIGTDDKRLDELMNCFFDKESRLSQRAAWAVDVISEKHPQIIEPYLERMLEALKTPQHDAVLRNTMRAIYRLPEIPPHIMGLAADAAFKFSETPSVPIAIRAYSLRVLAKISEKEPDLKPELRLMMDDILEYETSAGMISTIKDIFKKWAKRV